MKVAVLGAGDAGSQHVEAMKTAQGVSLSAVADVDAGRARRLAEACSVDVRSVDAVLQSTDIDAIAICTPPDVRIDLAVAALHEGKSVMLEKPVALDTKSLDRLRKTVEQTGRSASVMHQHRFAAALLGPIEDAAWATGVVATQTLRLRPPHCYTGNWRGEPDRSGGAVVAHLGVHILDIAFQLFGDPESIQVQTCTDPGYPIDSRATLTARLASGAMLASVASTLADNQGDFLRATTGNIEIEVGPRTVTRRQGDKVEEFPRPPVPHLRALAYEELAAATKDRNPYPAICGALTTTGVTLAIEASRRQEAGCTDG